MTLGQINYEAYCETTGWKSAVTGAPLPQWVAQSDLIHAAWENGAAAVAAEIARQAAFDDTHPGRN